MYQNGKINCEICNQLTDEREIDLSINNILLCQSCSHHLTDEEIKELEK